jgi:hypothetical protein
MEVRHYEILTIRIESLGSSEIEITVIWERKGMGASKSVISDEELKDAALDILRAAMEILKEFES